MRRASSSCRPRVETMEGRCLPATLAPGVGDGSPVVAALASLATTTTTIASSANPSAYNQTVTMTATVSGAPGGSAPMGTVTFVIDGGASMGSALLSPIAGGSTSTASLPIQSFLSTPFLPFPAFSGAGPHSITATYHGDANDQGSTSDALIQTVQQAPTGIGLASSANPSVAGQPITLHASVGALESTIHLLGPRPAGTITFLEGTTPLGTVPVTPNVVSGFEGILSTADLTLPSLSAGPHTLTATYSGDTNYLGATSTPFLQNTTQPTQTTLIAASNPISLGQPILVTAVVSGPAGGGVPTGSVVFLGGVGTVPLDASGRAIFAILPTTSGPFDVTASYGGDANFARSDATAVRVSVLLPSRTTLVASPNPGTQGQAETLTATVVGAPGASPTGTVTFLDGSTALGAAPIDATGHAVFTTTALGPGFHAISAAYGGDAQYGADVSTAATLAVDPAPPPPVVDGPRVTGPRRLGVHAQPTTLVLAFSGPLDPTRARDVANYVLVGPLGPHSSGRSIPIASAVYDPSTSTVALTPALRLNVHSSFRYRLTVVGAPPRGLTGADGVPLDGAGTGQPGTNDSATFSGFGLPSADPKPVIATGGRPGLARAAHSFSPTRR